MQCASLRLPAQHAASLAKALGISDAAVSQWKEVIPEKDAYRLEVVTAGALKYQESAYRKAA
ncbi:Cro/CI family transcriptional regulator [Escherichia coli]